MFTQTVEYALRALVALAAQPDTPQTTRGLAKVTKVPAPYLSKVLQLLTRAELVLAHRGVRGGFSLGRPADEITILEAVTAVDPIQRIKTCPLGLKAHGKHLCPLHKKMDAALAEVEAAFGSTTLADVLAEPTRSVPLCPFPRVAKPA
ncbi:MAG TPA: Rrf2 family transcriptional regulator [Pirellulales bacterium]|nr:Rrf2 family transcriptional regulator [Pirellulales bacterium]